jgi:hypothetical protein
VLDLTHIHMLNKSSQTNPYVVAIVPEPVDYFRACGLTSVCRSRCRAEIQAFEDANANPTRISQTFTVSGDPKSVEAGCYPLSRMGQCEPLVEQPRRSR